VLAGVRPAATQLSLREADLLQSLAATATRIVEIGVFEGLTSRRMLQAAPEGASFVGIDPFISGRIGISYGYWITRAQIRRARRPDVGVRILRKFSYECSAEFGPEFDLIFIDADHAYKSIKQDWSEWSAKLTPGGRIALHDSQPIPGRCPETSGPVRLVRELGKNPPGMELEQTQDTISVYRRVA
jgi:predicted O-methyltransferase YrrM